MIPAVLIAFCIATAAEPEVDPVELDERVMALFRDGLYEEAEEWARQSLDIRRSGADGSHRASVQLAESMNNLAVMLHAQGELTEARSLMEESVELTHVTLGPEHPEVLSGLNNLAALMRTQGDYEAARPHAERALAIARRAYPGKQELATALALLGVHYEDVGDYAAALPLIEESLEIVRALFEPTDIDVARGANNLAGVLGRLGDFAAARPLYEESIEIRRHALGPRHPGVGKALNNLAVFLKGLGDYDSARSLYEESLEIRREALGDDHPAVASTLSNFAFLLKKQGEPAAARAMLEESLDIRRRALGTRHPAVSNSLAGLASLHMEEHAYLEARPLYEESLSIRREVLGPRHALVATALGNLAIVSLKTGDLEAASAALEEVLDIRREVLAPGHPDIAEALTNLALVLDRQGEVEAKRAILDEAVAIMAAHLALLDTLTEREALRFLPTTRPTFDGWLGAFDRREDNARAWQLTLTMKGALAARARSARALATVEPDVADVAAELDAVRRGLAQLAFVQWPSEEREAKAEELGRLSTEQVRLERELMSRSAHHQRAFAVGNATPQAICEALPDGAAVIDIHGYRVDSVPRYMAFIVRSDDCVVHRVELGDAEPLDLAAAGWREVLRDADALPERVDKRGRQLSAMLWTPLSEVAGDREHWFVVPDGSMALIPFGALPTPTGFAIEEHLITYLDRAGDLLREPSTAGHGATVVGAVDYDAISRADEKSRALLAPCNGGSFLPLPGTVGETDRLVTRWSRSRRKEPLTLLRASDASESAVAMALEGKSLVHVATHGFFASADCKSALDDGVGYDPMLLSGLVFAGANQPRSGLSADDGILTALEVATLDLSVTNLVVLSACETGLGEVRSGQGVLGLRRAFAIAGARTLVMSLWAVSDQETATLMEAFYRLHLRRRGLPAAQALRAAQLDMLADQRRSGDEHPFAWAAFIASGDWRP